MGWLLNHEKKVIDGSLILIALLEIVYLVYINSFYLHIVDLRPYLACLLGVIFSNIAFLLREENAKMKNHRKIKNFVGVTVLLAVPFIYYCLAPMYTYKQAVKHLSEEEQMGWIDNSDNIRYSEKFRPRYYLISGDIFGKRKTFIFDPYDGQYWLDSGLKKRHKDISK